MFYIFSVSELSTETSETCSLGQNKHHILHKHRAYLVPFPESVWEIESVRTLATI